MIKPATYLLRRSGPDLYVVGGPYAWSDEASISNGVLGYMSSLPPDEEEDPSLYLLTFDSLGECQCEALEPEFLDAMLDLAEEGEL